MGLDAMILVFWMLSFKPTFSLSSFTFIKRLFSFFSLSTLTLVLYAHLRLLIFLLAVLIPACASSNPALCMMYSAYKLNKQGDNIQPWHTPFPIWKDLNIWKFTVHILLKPGLENFEHYFTSMWDECNCILVWTFGIAFLWDWNENWPFPVLWPLLSFPNVLTYCVQHFSSIIF